MNYHACWNRERAGKGKQIAEDVCVRKYACAWLRDNKCTFTPEAERLAKKHNKKKREKRNAA